ncbi:MAG: hypothetical protein ACI4JN_11110 [Ruminococcus sp.]
MTMEVTKKQAILLAVLGAVLLVMCYVQFLIRPVLSDISESKAQVEQLQQEYDNLVMQGQSYDQNVSSMQEWSDANKIETNKLYPLSEPQRIDNIITRVAAMFDANIKSLSISSLNQYYIDGEGNLTTADPAIVEASMGGDTAAEMEASAYTATGEYRRDFTYSLEGSYEDMVQLLNFVNNVSFLGITNFTFSSIETPPSAVLPADNDGTVQMPEESGFSDNYSFTITITAYMYSDPLKTIESDETEGTEPAENGTIPTDGTGEAA